MSRLAAPVLLTVIGCSWILLEFHDRSWWPPDEGPFVHVADRLLAGERLHRDIRDHHADSVHLVNAGALAVFGRDLKSLRYPVGLASLVYGLGVFALLRRRGAWLAALSALAATALGFVQFPNPTPNWYGLPIAVAAIGCLDRRSVWRIVAAGFAVGVAFGFRQLTAALLGIGVLGYLLVEARVSQGAGRAVVARGALAVALVGLCAYLLRTTDLLGWALFGLWPVGLLGVSLHLASTPDRVALRILGRLAAGFGLALLPMLAGHAWQGTLGDWWNGVIVSALEVPQLGYVGLASYGQWLSPAWATLLAPGSLLLASNALYWLVLTAVFVVSGGLALRTLMGWPSEQPLDLALPYVASFYALVSVFNQIPIYLYYGVSLSLAALVWQLSARGAQMRFGLAGLLVWLAATALVFHAAQPHTRTPEQVVAGARVALQANQRIPRASLWMEPDQERAIGDLIDWIRARTRADDSIWVVPNDAEVYFLAGRRNPVDFWNSALGIGDEAAEAALVDRLRRAPPALIVHVRGDKSTTPALLRVLAALEPLYAAPQRVHYFELLERLDPDN